MDPCMGSCVISAKLKFVLESQMKLTLSLRPCNTDHQLSCLRVGSNSTPMVYLRIFGFSTTLLLDRWILICRKKVWSEKLDFARVVLQISTRKSQDPEVISIWSKSELCLKSDALWHTWDSGVVVRLKVDFQSQVRFWDSALKVLQDVGSEKVKLFD